MAALRFRRPGKFVKEEPREWIEVEPYARLSRYYNEVMDHVDYVTWAKHVKRIAEAHQCKPRRVLDFACGTGTLALRLAEFGYHVIGVDGSEEMIEVAKRRHVRLSRSVEFMAVGMVDVPPVEPVDLAVCLYDSVNYLLKIQEVSKFFDVVHTVLKPGGLFICDLSTEHNSREHFDGYVIEEEVDGAWYKRVGRFDPVEMIQHNRFEIYPYDEKVVYLERHQQRVYQVDWFKRELEAHGLHVVAVYHNMTLKEGDETSDRVHIVAESV